ncbi:MAG: replication initiation protein [Cetobacterium sp.]
MSQIVKYDSKMNELNFSKFKEKELDIFFSICYKLKEIGLEEITLTFQELKELSNYKRTSLNELIQDIESVYDKILSFKFKISNDEGFIKFNLFNHYQVKTNEKVVIIAVNERYRFVLNDIDKFTKFDLIEFSNLSSSYARNMFRLLKQFDNNNKSCWYEVDIDKFKELLGIPRSYKMIDIDKRVLVPITQQLKPLFNNLKLEKIKKGVKVVALKFTWSNKKKSKTVNQIKIKVGLGEMELEQDLKLQQQQKEQTIDSLEVEKIEITRDEYEALYLEHLIKFNVSSNIYIRKTFDLSNSKKYIIIN